MELLRQEEQEIDECGTGRKKDSALTRCLRKKYKCIMMFLCIIALLLQTTYLIVEKTDSENINRIMMKLPNITKRIVKILNLFDHNRTNQETTETTTEDPSQPEYG